MSDRNVKFPLLSKPRPWAAIRVGATSDARWNGVPKNVKTVDRNAVRVAQLKARG